MGGTLSAEEIFASFIQAGFECSTHKLRNGRRLDLVHSTRHDEFAREDYLRVQTLGMRTVREALRWHLIERSRGTLDFSSAAALLDAARDTGTEQITDLFHFGWPDFIDIFDSEFVTAFTELAVGFARLLRSRRMERPFIAPINEISFVSWAGGDADYINPFERGRGHQLKYQLVRAGIVAAKAFLSELPETRLVWPEPVIHIEGDPAKPGDPEEAEAYRRSMFEAWDMISGRLHPELGGDPTLLQIIGVNYYDRNQWMNHGDTIRRSNPLYRPFHRILCEVWERYRVPMFVSETGTEDDDRPDWFAYIASEVRKAIEAGVPMHGICLYPILNHPGWDDDRHCYNGLFDYADDSGAREVYQPLEDEIRRQTALNDDFMNEREYSNAGTNIERSTGR